MKRLEQCVGWLVKAAFIIATGHATLRLMADTGAPWLVQGASVVLIEGVLLHYWLLVEYGTDTRREVRAKNVAMAWLAFVTTLAAGAATGQPINVLVRVAAALGLFNATSDVLLGWLALARSKEGTSRKRERAFRRAGFKAFRRLLKRDTSDLEAHEQAYLRTLLSDGKPARAVQAPSQEEIICPVCGRNDFKSKQALAGHQSGKSQACLERARSDGRQRVALEE